MTEYSPAKTGEYPRIFPNFQNCARCENDLKDNKDNSRHWGREYTWIFVLGHYLFLVAHSFPRASLSENCSLLGTDNVRGQISEHIFLPNGDYTPNANMADHSDGPGLVAWKRGQSVCQSRLFPNVLIIANGCMCSD